MNFSGALRGWFVSFAVSSLFVIVSPLQAQISLTAPTPAPLPEDGTLITEGVANDMDLHRRGPVLTVTIKHVAEPKHVTLLVDAYVPNQGYAKYPIRFDFFVNRRLFSSQYRSDTLPGPVGVDVGEDVAVSPFNFSVVATVLHPNRQFTTVIEGASEIVSSPVVATVDCTMTVQPSDSASSADVTDFVGNAVTPAQQQDNSWLVSFDGRSAAGSDTAAVKATARLDTSLDGADINASASVEVVSNGSTRSFSLSGTANVSGGVLKALDISDDSGNRLLCE